MANRPRLCAHCGKLMGIVRECPYCGADNGALTSRLRRALASSSGGGLGVTETLITVNVFLFVAAVFVGGAQSGAGFDVLSPDTEVLFRLGLQYNPAIDAGQWWRLVMMVFLHLGLLHVAFNCYILYFAGRMLEMEYGGRLMFLVYITAGLAGSLASYVAGIGGAGASGAVFGLLGAIIVRRRIVDGNFQHPLTRNLIVLLVLNGVFGLTMPGINNVAHGAGLVAGTAVSWVVTSVRLSRTGALVMAGATWAGVGVTGLAFVMMVLSLFHGSSADFQQAYDCWRKTDAALTHAFAPDLADASLRCLSETGDLEPEANAARDRARSGIDAALRAYDDGDGAGVRRGLQDVRGAVNDFAAWEAGALPRYGLMRTDSIGP